MDNRHLPTASDRFGRAPGFLWAPFGRTRPQKHTLGQTRDLKHRKLQVVQPNEIYRTLHYDAACILMAVLLDLYHDPFIELLNDPFLFQSVTLLFPIWLCTSHRLKGASGGGHDSCIQASTSSRHSPCPGHGSQFTHWGVAGRSSVWLLF